MTISSRRALGFAFATLVAGCGAGSVDPADAQVVADGTQAMIADAQSTYLGSLAFEAVTVTDPLAAAGQLAPSTQSCVTYAPVTDPSVAHIVLNGCTGPFGLDHISGQEEVTFSAGVGVALHAVITGVGVTADSGPITFSAMADITLPSPTTRGVVWEASWVGTDDLGETVTHASDLEIAVDMAAGCHTADGSAETSVGSRSVDTSISGFKVCRDPSTGEEGCPSGSVVHTGSPSGRVVSIAFDDSAVADVTGPGGNTFEVGLTCTSIGR